MTTTPDEPLGDDEMTTEDATADPMGSGDPIEGMGDADGTDADGTDGTDGDSTDADGTDADGTDGTDGLAP